MKATRGVSIVEWNDSLVATDGLRSYSTDSQNPIVSNITDCCVVEIEGNYTGKAATNKKNWEKSCTGDNRLVSIRKNFPLFSRQLLSTDRTDLGPSPRLGPKHRPNAIRYSSIYTYGQYLTTNFIRSHLRDPRSVYYYSSRKQWTSCNGRRFNY